MAKYLKSGALKKRERRRLINPGKPGTVVVMQADGVSVGKRREGGSFSTLKSSKARSAKVGGLFEAGMRVEDTLAYDFDARLLVEYVQAELAAFLQDRMTEGRDPVSGAPHPPLAVGTLRRKSASRGTKERRDIKRVSNDRAMRTGTLRDMWGMGPIKGSYASASASVKPGGDKLDKGRSIFINSDLGKGIDYGAVTGDAGEVIARAFQAFMDASKADSGGYVRVPRQPRLVGGFTDPDARPLRTPKPSPGSPEDEGQ